ncbi:MAG: helix-turn-helix transcriptional regulator [Collinsella sp.]|nr:helix-turn-helix transcriptional regulator [Collinsella sp.]
MASTLQELRKQAGYRTAPEFARAMEIPESTYARYESSPDKIPLDKAWRLADVFGCSIDALVGREHIEVGDARGEVQRAYDALSPDSRGALDKYLAFLVQSDADERTRAEEVERRRFESLAASYETLYINSLNESAPFGELADEGDPEKRRDGFRAFITLMAEEKRGESGTKFERIRDEAVIAKIMDAYDRIHWADLSRVEYASRADLSDRLFISFDSAGRAKRGGEGASSA